MHDADMLPSINDASVRTQRIDTSEPIPSLLEHLCLAVIVTNIAFEVLAVLSQLLQKGFI